MKKYIFIILSILIYTDALHGQGNFNMGAVRNVTNGCGASIFDHGGPSGNYGANRNDTITIFSNDPNNPAVQIKIMELGLHDSDTIFVYDSDQADPARLVDFGGNNFFLNSASQITVGEWLYTATITNPSGAITIRLKSDGANHGSGFRITAECRSVCQRINAFINPTACIPPLVEEDGYWYANVCEYQSLTVAGYAEYPDNTLGGYTQSHDSTYFSWNVGDTTYRGWGLTNINHYFEPGRGYEVKLFMRDQRGCINQNSASIRVRTSVNPIRGIAALPDVCSGTPINLNVGYSAGSSVLVEPIVSTQQYSLGFDSTMYVPDGPNCAVQCYSTNVTFTEFGPNQTISSASDIVSICFSMEHTFLGDLQFKLVCPNGQFTTMHGFRNNGSNTNNAIDLGIAISGSSPACQGNPNLAGTGWNYCWSENTSLGFQYRGAAPHYIYLNQTTTCDSTNRQNNTNYYRPFNSFASLIGCPLNGVWAIEICDNWGVDDGWIFGWQLTLDPNLLPQAWSYTVLVEEVLWSGPMITSTSDTTAVIQTPQAGVFDYTFTVIDEFGCAYDSTLQLNVVQSPIFDLGNDIAICEGQLIQIDPNYNIPGAVYQWSDFTNDPLLTTTVPGNYCLTITQSNGNITCQSSDCIDIDIFPQPTANFSAVPTEGCSPLLVQFTDMSTPTGITLNYFWDFGDPNTSQNTSNLQNPAHIYANYGLYDVSLRIVTEHGCQSEITKPGFITVHATPIANFVPSQSEVSLSDNPVVNFTNTTENYTPSNTTWAWSFGDGNNSTEHSPSHTYTSPNDYSVVLIVSTDKGCGDTISKIIIVEDDIFIPNIITPNGDGVNDVLVIGNINPLRINSLKIYNRWGKKVYDQANYKPRARCIKLGEDSWSCNEYEDIDMGWGDQNIADGVYYYVFTYQGVTKEVQRNGTITVLSGK